MARTFGGLIFYNALGVIVPTANVGVAAGNYALTRNAAGDWSWNNVAGAATVVLSADNSNLTRPYITLPAFPGQGTVPTTNEFQEAFGTSAGSPGNPFSGVAAGSTTAVGAVGGGVFGTPNVPWGLAIIDIFAVYSVQTAALTAATLQLNRNIFVENTATTNTTVLAATGVALTTTTSATTPHVQRVALAQPLVYETADFSSLILEFSVNAAATSAVRVYGLGMHVAVEYS
jgi:hypothetical protein